MTTRSILVLVLVYLPSVVFPQLTLNPLDSSAIIEKKVSLATDYLGVMETMNAYLEADPGNGKVYYNLAISKFYMGDLEGCCADLEMARQLGVKRNPYLYKLHCDKDFIRNSVIKSEYDGVKVHEELGYRPEYTRSDSLRGALRPERTCFDVCFYDLTVRIFPWNKSISGKNKIRFKAVQASRHIQLDLFRQFTINRIVMDEKELNFVREEDAIFVEFPEVLIPGSFYTLQVEYSGKPQKAKNPPWQGGFDWSHDLRMNHWVGVACEHLGASSWWPVKDHLSDRPDSMNIHLEVPDSYQAICNGSLLSIEKADSRYTRYNWQVNYPINSYNVTFYMGKYTSFTDTLTCVNDTLIALYHVMPYNMEKAKNHFIQARDVVNYYCHAFGPFPFPDNNFRMVESPYEGMEHQTAIAYGNSYSNAKNALGYLNRKYDYIIVHEAAHEWWGNSVTAADMADIWLHEGFATYAEFMFLEEMEGYEQSIREMNFHWKHIYNIYPLIGNRNVNENTFVSSDVYYKGAALLQCLRATINNDSLFKNMLRDFHLKFRDTTIETMDFINFVHAYTKTDFTSLFEVYLFKTELPVLQYTYRRVEENLVVKYWWTGVGDGFTMPFSIQSLETGKSTRIVGTTLEQEFIIENSHSFQFYTSTHDTEGIPHNGLTYYRTKCLNFE